MLKKWIDEIRTKPDLYKSECWKYHISGNVVELSILPVYQKKKESYRCSVIAVGQVLMALSKKIEEQNLSFHIQSFPSLENPEIVAAIRTGAKGNFINHLKTSENRFNEKKEITDTLYNLVGHYHFSVQKADDFTETAIDEIASFKNYKSWHVISSAHNNPFTWLNVGYLKESLRNISSYLPADSLGIFDLCSGNKTQHTNLQTFENKYPQFLIGIQPVNVSTG